MSQLLVLKGADIFIHYRYVAALHNHAETIDLLVEAGANLEARNIFRCRPLHLAANQPNPEALLALWKHGAGVNA